MKATKKKILITDDDIDVITAVTSILKKEGYEVIPAMNKKEALEILRSEKPDVAILDVMMTTHYEGFELAREMLEKPVFKNIPVVIQTSLEVLVTTKSAVREMAREYRKDPLYKDLQVLLLKNPTDGTAGVDYRDEEGRSHWIPVNGFIKKPVDAQKLSAEVARHV